VAIGDGGRDGNGNGRVKEQYLDQGMQDIVVASNRFDKNGGREPIRHAKDYESIVLAFQAFCAEPQKRCVNVLGGGGSQ
jgi:hypothetical protein